MATNAAKLSSYLNLLDRTFDFDQGLIEEAPNGDHYIEFSITSDNRLEERLERLVVNTINRAVDPDAYGIDTGPTGGQNASTYTLIYDKSSNNLDLIGGEYSTYRNDLAGISDSDVPFARSGFATGIFLDGHAYRIAVPDAVVFGTRVKDWTANWWTWALQAPLERNPLLDTTGEDADVGNTGPVFYLAGNLSEDPSVERRFTVPEGHPVLIPVQNFVSIPFETDPAGYAAEQVALWEASVDVTSLSATIDGDSVENIEEYLVKSDPFTPGQPQAGSLLNASLPPELPPEDDLYPSLSSGYWLMIEGLTPGQHTITVSGTAGGGSTGVTDYILVV
ncbi:hypothetical protein JKG68_29320 [Microvirga aerilata]|uniref:Uncharacterized protein n=1 Tax=Microvirga aerilata TaxID=670292 RepID=A0A937D3P4_9HYPH|nr:hypothetical protein [Microvirga aerilata]MBL0408002.1 hypothetical protein [Microvirga aerilata]